MRLSTVLFFFLLPPSSSSQRCPRKSVWKPAREKCQFELPDCDIDDIAEKICEAFGGQLFQSRFCEVNPVKCPIAQRPAPIIQATPPMTTPAPAPCPFIRWIPFVSTRLNRFWKWWGINSADHAFILAGGGEGGQVAGYAQEWASINLVKLVTDTAWKNKRCPKLQKVVHFYSSTNNDHYMTFGDAKYNEAIAVSSESCEQLLQRGDSARAHLGWAAPSMGYCGANKRVDEYWSDLWKDTFYVWEDGERPPPTAPHMKPRIEFYFFIWAEIQPIAAERQQLTARCA